jgi:filamentous hemagglutinin
MGDGHVVDVALRGAAKALGVIVAGKTLALQSGGDTTLKGASGKAEQIIASVGGNLLLESLQGTSKYDSKNKSAGFGVSLCIPLGQLGKPLKSLNYPEPAEWCRV